MSYFCKRFQFGLAVERRCKDMKRNRKAQPKAGLIRLKAISKPLRENRRRMEDGRESVAWTGGVKNAGSGEKVRPSEKMHLLSDSSVLWPVAQSVERLTHNEKVAGSSPALANNPINLLNLINMNKQRRKDIEDVIGKLEDIKSQIESIYEEEYDAYSSLPDSIQESERGETMSQNSDDLDQAAQDLDDIISNLQEIVER